MKTFKAVAWIHPKNGGDDRMVELKVIAESKRMAGVEIERWLRKQLAVTTDYKIE